MSTSRPTVPSSRLFVFFRHSVARFRAFGHVKTPSGCQRASGGTTAVDRRTSNERRGKEGNKSSIFWLSFPKRRRFVEETRKQHNEKQWKRQEKEYSSFYRQQSRKSKGGRRHTHRSSLVRSLLQSRLMSARQMAARSSPTSFRPLLVAHSCKQKTRRSEMNCGSTVTSQAGASFTGRKEFEKNGRRKE